MSETKQSDVLAYFQRSGDANGIPAEAQSALRDENDKDDKIDPLLKDFKPGFFFTADTFTFGATLADDEGENLINPEEGRSYGRWRALKIHEPKPTPPFRTEPDDVSITRMIDSSSPLLLNHCLDTKSFSKAVIVKRSRNGADGKLLPILRLEFTTVWIKVVEWEDGDAIVETVKFKFNAVEAIYVKRKSDGTVGSQWPAKWASPLTAAIRD